MGCWGSGVLFCYLFIVLFVLFVCGFYFSREVFLCVRVCVFGMVSPYVGACVCACACVRMCLRRCIEVAVWFGWFLFVSLLFGVFFFMITDALCYVYMCVCVVVCFVMCVCERERERENEKGPFEHLADIDCAHNTDHIGCVCLFVCWLFCLPWDLCVWDLIDGVLFEMIINVCAFVDPDVWFGHIISACVCVCVLSISVRDLEATAQVTRDEHLVPSMCVCVYVYVFFVLFFV